MAHDARAIANLMLCTAHHDGNRLNQIQLIKLVYFGHAWMLALHGQPLIRQPVEAWEYGPQIPDVWQAFRHHGPHPVTEPAPVAEPPLSEAEAHIAAQTYRQFGYLTDIRLSQLAHAPGTPWSRVWQANRKRSIIPNRMLQEYYARKLRQPTVGGAPA